MISPLFEEFLNVARQYCNVYETYEEQDQRKFISFIQTVLLDLYSRGRALPKIYPPNEEFDDLLERNDRQIQEMISHKLPFIGYWLALEPFSLDECELGLGDLSDDLGDIYIDLKRSILLYDSKQEGAVQLSYWKLKDYFDFHTADHCMNAIKAIHDYLTQDVSTYGW